MFFAHRSRCVTRIFLQFVEPDSVIEDRRDLIVDRFQIRRRIRFAFIVSQPNKGKIDPKTLTLHIEDLFVNDALSRFGNAKNHLEKMKAAEVPKAQRKEQDALIEEFETGIEESKISLMDSGRLVSKENSDIAVRISPDFPAKKPE